MSRPATPPTRADLLEHAGFVRMLARALVVGEAEADDLVQDTWLTALRSPPRRSTNLRGWLATVLRNLARMRYRTDRRRAVRETATARADRTPAADETAARLEIQRHLVDAVSALEEPFRTTVVLRYFDGLRPAEIARRQGVPANTVHSRLARALERLRVRLDGSRMALLPLAGLSVKEAAALTGGGVVMGMKVKLGLAAVVLVALGATAWFGITAFEKPDPYWQVAATPGPLADSSVPAAETADAEPKRGGGPADGVAPAEPEPEPATPGKRSPLPLMVTVLDALGDPVPGAVVTYVPADGEGRLEVVVGPSGRTMLDVPGPGLVTAERQGSGKGSAETGSPPEAGEWAVVVRLRLDNVLGSGKSDERPPAVAAALAGRTGEARAEAAGGDKATERAVDLGLAWLAGHQSPDGSWKAGTEGAETRVTALALLAFLGAGETHAKGRYRKTVTRGFGRLGETADAPTDRTGRAAAVQALAEAWTLTGSAELREVSQRRVDLLADGLDDEYTIEETVWTACALIAARLGKLTVDEEAVEWARRRLAASLTRLDKEDGVGMAGTLFCLGVLDPKDADSKDRRRLSKALSKLQPRWDRGGKRVDFPAWHFGTLAAFQAGGSTWKGWNRFLSKYLPKGQRTDEGDVRGSWDPLGAQAATLGRAGVTALAVLTLETYYRYPRPLSIE